MEWLNIYMIKLGKMMDRLLENLYFKIIIIYGNLLVKIF